MTKAPLWMLSILCMASIASGAVRAEPKPVDLELAFVVDASGSIDDEETRLQRRGYADALSNRHVLNAIQRGYLQSIAVAYIEFAADGCDKLSVPWTRIHDQASARAFGERVLAQPREYCPGGNAIGNAIAFAHASLATNGFEGTRRVIDVSGDGPNTLGRPVTLARDLAVAAGITINGLVIDRPSMPELEDYFKSAIIGGPRSFVIKAENRRVFAAAILKKLIIEIAGSAPKGFSRLLKNEAGGTNPSTRASGPAQDEEIL